MAKGRAMILDTCALLWLSTESKRLSRTTLKSINEASILCVSAISAFEIALKSAHGKLNLPLPITEWFKQVTEHHGISIVPLEIEVCVAAAELPAIHEDPCDRFIIAAAKLNDWPVVTEDERFEEYGVEVIGGH